MTNQEIYEILKSKQWKFAKTAKYSNPHWYTLRETWNDDLLFETIVQSIRDNSYVEYFWKKPYQIMLHEGWKYWSMGAPLDETILINKSFDMWQYNKIANSYDSLFVDKESQAENQHIADMLYEYRNDLIYDIGCGTGLLLEMIDILPKNYIGLDPSYPMIKIAREKYPEHKFLVDRCETYRTMGHKDIENSICVSLFGSMNYVLPDYIQRIRHYSRRFFLMFYKEDYEPVTYEMMDVKFYHHKYTKAELEEAYGLPVTEFNNYYIVRNI